MIAPNRDGWPVHPRELELPHTTLDPGKIESFNNHHRFWTRKNMGRLVTTQTLRDLEDSQTILPKDTHAIYHALYTPPPLPSMSDMMERLQDAYDAEELLRYGSAREPQYKVFGHELWELVKKEYDERNMRMTA